MENLHLQLLVRNYDANQGELLLAEKPISAYSEETLRRQICFFNSNVFTYSAIHFVKIYNFEVRIKFLMKND